MIRKPLTLVIVDGYDRARAALTERLQRAADVPVPAVLGDLVQAVELVGRVRPHAVLLEPRTVGMPLPAAVQQLVGTGAPIVVYTASPAIGEAAQFARAGASATLLRDTDFSGLLRPMHLGISEQERLVRGAR